MNNRYFTFGQIHTSTYPLPSPGYGGKLSDYWVTVDLSAGGGNDHRALFMDNFTRHYCPRPLQFALEYSDANHKPEYFPGGELCRITEKGIQ